MERSPVSENSPLEVDLYTPPENLNKQCHEITPDNLLKPVTKSLHGTDKVTAVGFSQKLSKRKLFEQPAVGRQSGKNCVNSESTDFSIDNESVAESAWKKKRLDETSKNSVKNPSTNIADQCPTIKRALTERQQLAFLLEATSTRDSPKDENDRASTFTKIRARRRAKGNEKCANPRVSRRNERGETPLHLAAIKGDVVALKKLFRDGADVGVKDYAGWTALHEACNHGNLAAATFLVKYGASVNVPGFEGDTPLHDAVINNHVEVVDMLLSNGANPHQKNMRRKRPTDLICSKEMSDIFTMRGVQHTAFQLKESHSHEAPTTTTANVAKDTIETERCMKSSILGNEIQRKETQGESKMEKPVMYICKLETRNEELTIRTTQVTSYRKCSNVIGESESTTTSSQVASSIKPSEEQKEVLVVSSMKPNEEQKEVSETFNKVCKEDEVQSSIAFKSFTARGHEVKEVVVKDTSLLEAESRDQVKITNTESKQPVGPIVSENLETEAKEKSENEQASTIEQDKVIDNTIAKLPVSADTSEVSFTSRAQETATSLKMKQKFVNDDYLVNGKTRRESFSHASENLMSKEKLMSENDSSQLSVERSRTPEIDESIAVEVLSTGLFSGGFSQYYSTSSARQQDMRRISHGKNLIGEEASGESAVTNAESFLDVEGLDPELKENYLSTAESGMFQGECGEYRGEYGEDRAERGEDNRPSNQLFSSFGKVDTISSSSNDINQAGETLSSKEKMMENQHVVDYPKSMIVSIAVNENAGFTMVAENGCMKQYSGSPAMSNQMSSSNSYSGARQPFVLTSENTAVNSERKGKEKTASTGWYFDCTSGEGDEKDSRHRKDVVARVDTILAEKSVTRNTAVERGPINRVHNEIDLRPGWLVEKKGLKVDRMREKKRGLRNEAFNGEDEVACRNNVQQPFSSSNQGDVSLRQAVVTQHRSSVVDVQRQKVHNTLGSKEERRSGLDFSTPVVMKPSKLAETWQSLMAAGRSRLAELRIPGYDQFLMNTKEYELAKDSNQEKNVEIPSCLTLTNEEKLALKHEKSKEELLRKQRSEQDKLQLCMEQEIVRFYARKAYSSLDCIQPPGVCTAIHWQNMSSQQLQNVKKNLSKKLLEKETNSPSKHQEIVEKYEKLKSQMGQRHKHEQQSLDAIIIH